MSAIKRIGATLAATFLTLGALTTSAAAQQAAEFGIGQSAPGQLDMQEPVTPIAEAIFDLHHLMLVIITAITVFVLVLLAIVIVRYNSRANPKPATWTHNTLIEVIWTAAPVVILVVIAIPSVRLLQLQEDFTKVEPDVVIKATGYQWYWGYQYSEAGIEFDSNMLGKGSATMTEEVKEELNDYGYPENTWKLATDTAMIVPVNKTVLMQITAADVIHAWAVPAFGVKADGVPGRINQQWFKVTKEGVYFGQCSELCGRDHSYMPITVRAVSEPVYNQWVACMQEEDDFETCAPKQTMNEMIALRDGIIEPEAVELAALPAAAE